MEITPGEDSMKIVEMTTGLRILHLVGKGVTGFEEMSPILKEVLLWVKCYQTALHATEKSFMKGRINQCGNLQSNFKKFPPPLQLQQPPP